MAKPSKKVEVVVVRKHRGVVLSVPKGIKALRLHCSKAEWRELIRADLEFQERDPKFWVIPSREGKKAVD